MLLFLKKKETVNYDTEKKLKKKKTEKKKKSFGRMFAKVVKYKPDIMLLNVFGSILWKEAVS